MRVLFIGGTGNISSACTKLAAERGIDLWLFNRGISQAPVPPGTTVIHGDIRNLSQARQTLQNRTFDAVVDWVAYETNHIEADIALFAGRTAQFLFISSAAAYQRPPASHLVTEATPLANPFWQYAKDKIACEQRLLRAHGEEGFPVTIVRPSLTYGETWIPCAVGGHDYTVVNRMLEGKKVIVHGDGTSLWTVTHNTDFAQGLLGLIGNAAAIGESFHITSDEVLTWNRIYETIGAAAGVKPDLLHVPSEYINAFDLRMGASLLGDKAHSVVFDNSKIKRFVPEFQATVTFAEGIRRSMEWFNADPKRKKIDEERDRLMDRIVSSYLSAWSQR